MNILKTMKRYFEFKTAVMWEYMGIQVFSG